MLVSEVIELASQRFYQNSELQLETNFCIDAINECIAFIDSVCIAHNSEIGTATVMVHVTADDNTISIGAAYAPSGAAIITGIKAVHSIRNVTADFLMTQVPPEVIDDCDKTQKDPAFYALISGDTIKVMPKGEADLAITYWKDNSINSPLDPLPFYGLFDYTILNYIVMKAKLRDDENFDAEKFFSDSFATRVETILDSRRGSSPELPMPFQV